jgi:dihydrofolate reductase
MAKEKLTMRKLILKMSISVDGFVCGPDGELDWIFKSYDSGATDWTMKTLWNAGIHIMGSRTFRDMAAHWPTSDEVFAAPMNEIPKAVFTKKGLIKSPSIESITAASKDTSRSNGVNGTILLNDKQFKKTNWEGSEVIGGDLAKEIGRMKQQLGKDILAHGGARFAQNLVSLGLVDEYRLLIHPIVLGTGLPLFSGLTAPVHLKLVDKETFDSGAAAHIYQPYQ